MKSANSQLGTLVISKRTPEETVRGLIRAGIYNEDGTLTPHYQPRPKPKKKSAKG